MRKMACFIFICALFLLGARGGSGGGDYRLYTEKSKHNIDYRVNDFYWVYYVYMNVIRALDARERIPAQDMQKVIALIIDNIKKNNVVQLQIDNHKNSGTLRVTIRDDVDADSDKPALWIISNYNASTQKVVSGDDQKDAYGTFFYIDGDKLVKYQYVRHPKTDDELKKLSANDLADYYLFDGDSKNDKRGMELVLKEIETGEDDARRAISCMTLSEYYLLFGKPDSAKEAIEKARAIVRSLSDQKKRQGLTSLLEYADDIYRYYVKYTGRS